MESVFLRSCDTIAGSSIVSSPVSKSLTPFAARTTQVFAFACKRQRQPNQNGINVAALYQMGRLLFSNITANASPADSAINAKMILRRTPLVPIL